MWKVISTTETKLFSEKSAICDDEGTDKYNISNRVILNIKNPRITFSYHNFSIFYTTVWGSEIEPFYTHVVILLHIPAIGIEISRFQGDTSRTV